MLLDLVVHLTELLVVLLTGMMLRRMFRLHRVRTAFEPTAPADHQPDPALSAARPVSKPAAVAVASVHAAKRVEPTELAPAPAPAPAMVLASYIDELLGAGGDVTPTADPEITEAPPTRLLLSPSPNRQNRPAGHAGQGPETAYQPIATILNKRCDLG